MKNLIKSDIYQLKKNRTVWIIFFVFLFITLFQCYVAMTNEVEGYRSGGEFLAMFASSVVLFTAFFALLFTAAVCGEGFKDKTFNYNIMSGHSRGEVFLSRLVLSLAGSVIGVIILTALQLALIAVVLPFSSKTELFDFLLRALLMLFPIIRLVCEMMFITYIVKNEYIAMIISAVIFYVGLLFDELFMGESATSNYLLGILNVTHVFKHDVVTHYQLVSRVDFNIVQYGVDMKYALATIVASLAFAALFAGLGYKFFNEDDFS